MKNIESTGTKRVQLRRWAGELALPGALAAMLICGSASAVEEKSGQQTSKSATASKDTQRQAPAAATYTVTGFRSARFGMNETAVRQAIAKDLGATGAAIKVEENPQQRTKALVVTVPSLQPGPGSAIVSYIFGHKSQNLIQVNVVWGLEPKAEQSAAINQAAAQEIYSAANTLSYYFADYTWRDGGIVRNALIDPTTLMLFHGEDTSQGAAEIVLGNVAIDVQAEGDKVKKTSKPTGNPYLRVSYVSNRTKPDVFALPKGDF